MSLTEEALPPWLPRQHGWFLGSATKLAFVNCALCQVGALDLAQSTRKLVVAGFRAQDNARSELLHWHQTDIFTTTLES